MYYKVKIPEPCSEDWSTMTPTEKGRFCDNCEKEVVDFTQFSQREIAIRIKNGERVCGRFRKDQLENPYFLPDENGFRYWKLVAGFSSLLALCSASETFAQGEPAIQYTQQDIRETKSDTLVDNESIISGKIADDENQPVFGALVTLKGTSLNSRTDLKGNFTLTIPNDKVNEDTQIQIGHIGYQRKIISISDFKEDQEMQIKLKPHILIMGEVVAEKHQNKR